LDAFGNIDSKYRFIILAAKRAKQLLKGAKPKIQSKSKSLIRIAQAEVRQGLIEYEIIPARMDEIPEREERVFVGAGLADEAGDMDALSGKDLAEEEHEAEPEGELEEDEGGDEEAGEEEEGSKSDKDE
jgi:DNA-directed RNA polymerase omega subunit